MPIIRTSKTLPDNRPLIEVDGDTLKINHVENVETLARHCRELRKDPGNGFSKKRGFRLIARLPVYTFLEHKEFANEDGTINKRELKKYLNGDGAMFKTVDKGI